MFAKWMMLQVPPEQQENFSQAQTRWQAIADCVGLVAQFGGWLQQHAQGADALACIFGLWTDPWAYSDFMSESHDKVTESNAQAQTYCNMRINYWLSKATQGEMDFNKLLMQASLLRVAQCEIRPERRAHFERVQTELWFPGMQAAGMSAGLFWQGTRQRSDAENQYLVTSFWADAAGHQAYEREHFAALKNQAQVDKDLRQIQGYTLTLETAWTVLGPCA